MPVEAVAPLVRPESVPFHLLHTFRVVEVKKGGGQGQGGSLASEWVSVLIGVGGGKQIWE